MLSKTENQKKSMKTIGPAKSPNQKHQNICAFPKTPIAQTRNKEQSRRSCSKREKSNAEKLNAHGIGRAEKSREKKFREQEQVEKTVARDQPA
jgi:hypothetical protein